MADQKVVIKCEKEGKKNKFRTHIYGISHFMTTEEAIEKFSEMKKKMGSSMQVVSEKDKKSGVKTKGKKVLITDPVISFGGNDGDLIKNWMVKLNIVPEDKISVT